MRPLLRHRFPGAMPFVIEDKDVFHGRKNDVERIYDLLMAKRMLTLYAESGFGKTSLVNAGLLPRFENATEGKSILPVKIRFGLPLSDRTDAGDQDILFSKIITEIEEHKRTLNFTENKLPFIVEPISSSLWCEMKLFERNALTVVLIFDQFEEVFTYSTEQVEVLKKQLHSLFSGVPRQLDVVCSNEVKKIEKEIHDPEQLSKIDKDLEFMYAPLNTKILFVIRDDKFGQINLFADYFPDILKDSLKLAPLSRSAAKEAIELPALAKGDFNTPPFTFTPLSLEKLLDKLAEKNTYDPFTIQITCRYIERNLVEKKGKTTIEEADIPEVSVIVKDFIGGAWQGLNMRDSEPIKQAIEENLIAHDVERRISVHEGDWIEEIIANTLITEGLLKRERRGGIDYIELSHDRLIKPLLEDYKKREQDDIEKRQQKMRIGIFTVLIVALLGVSFYIYYENKNLESKNRDIISANTDLTDSLRIVETNFNVFKKEEIAEHGKEFNKELEKKDTIAAINNLKKAISFDFNNHQKLDTTLDKLLKSKYGQQTNLIKVDIFYTDREYENKYNNGQSFQYVYSEEIAGQLKDLLEKEKNLVVRIRLLRPKYSSGNPFLVYTNEIRFDSDEKNQAEKIKEIAGSLPVQKPVEFFMALKSRTNTPNYISILLKNSTKPK